MTLTIEELKAIRDSLRECVPDPEIDFGPAYEGAKERKQLALRLLRKAIHELTPPVDEKKILDEHSQQLARAIDLEVMDRIRLANSMQRDLYNGQK